MTKELVFHGRSIQTSYSSKAKEIAAQLSNPIVIEIQIYFSCMLGKRLAYYSDAPIPGTYQLEANQFKDIIEDSQHLTGKIYIRFNTVITKSCLVSDYIGPPPVTDFPIVNKEVFVPNWLNIDFAKGVFTGEYGWTESEPGRSNTFQVRGASIRSDSKPHHPTTLQ